MKIRDIMRPGPYTIGENETLGAAQRVMIRSHVRHLPVVREARLVGILSQRDVLAARGGIDEDWWAYPVATAMHSPVQTAGPDDSLTEVAGRLAQAKIGAMPVVDRGRLIGLVTVTDLLDAEVRAAMQPTPATTATAVDAMTPFPFTIRPETPLIEAVAVMVDRHVRHVPVVDATSSIVGMLSERDVRTAVGDPIAFRELRGRSQPGRRVRDVMTRPAVPVAFDRPIVDIARLFADGTIEAVPVVDKFGALLGIISYVDVLRALAH
jgi:CBS-domain-containing membrane protein